MRKILKYKNEIEKEQQSQKLKTLFLSKEEFTPAEYDYLKQKELEAWPRYLVSKFVSLMFELGYEVKPDAWLEELPENKRTFKKSSRVNNLKGQTQINFAERGEFDDYYAVVVK